MIRRVVGTAVLAILASSLTLVAAADSTAVAKSASKVITAGKFTFTYTMSATDLTGTVSYPTNGWVAIGFGAKSVMKRAHILMGSVDGGAAIISEEYGSGMFSHQPLSATSKKSTMIASSCVSINGVTTLSFTILLDNLGNHYETIVPGKKIKIIFAAGETGDIRKKHKDKAEVKTTL